MAMVLVATFGALAAVLTVGVLVLVRAPGDVPRLVRWSGLAITALVAVLLTPLTVRDSGSAALLLLGVPVVAAAVPALTHRLVGRAGPLVDLVAALVIGGWGLLLALGGIGVAFLPSALLFAAGAAWGLAPGHRPPRAPSPTH